MTAVGFELERMLGIRQPETGILLLSIERESHSNRYQTYFVRHLSFIPPLSYSLTVIIHNTSYHDAISPFPPAFTLLHTTGIFPAIIFSTLYHNPHITPSPTQPFNFKTLPYPISSLTTLPYLSCSSSPYFTIRILLKIPMISNEQVAKGQRSLT